jgi:hypothetical protein
MAGNSRGDSLKSIPPLILKRAPVGDNQDDYDVLENGVVVGRIFVSPTAPTPPSYESAGLPAIRFR